MENVWVRRIAIALVLVGMLIVVVQGFTLNLNTTKVSAAPEPQISLGGNESPTVKSFEKTDISANGYALYLLYINVSMQADKVCPVWVKDGSEPPITQGCA